MENEELHWKMRQSLDHSYGGNCSGLLSMSVIEGNALLLYVNDSLPPQCSCERCLSNRCCVFLHRVTMFVGLF